MRVRTATAELWLGLQRWDFCAWIRYPPGEHKWPRHLATGLLGERETLFYLRKLGYVVVARR